MSGTVVHDLLLYTHSAQSREDREVILEMVRGGNDPEAWKFATLGSFGVSSWIETG
jgi:hypothetical protein